MTESTVRLSPLTPDSLAAFDWRVGRNWLVLIGSALATGGLGAGFAYVVSAVILGLPSAGVSSSHVAMGWIIGGLLFALVVALMGSLATRGCEQRKEETERPVGPMARRAALRLDLAIFALWCVVYILPSPAMLYLFFSLPDTTGAGEVTMIIFVMGMINGQIFLPGLLQRWGRKKVARHA